VAIVTSQAAQFSVIGGLQLEAQQKAVRALAYNDHLTAYAIAENQIGKLGTPKLAILPSAQALTEKAWHVLLQYANEGGHLLITGPVDYDEHWHHADRTAQLKLEAHTEPLTYHDASPPLTDHTLTLSFDMQKQTWLDALHFDDGSTLKEIPYGKGRIFWAAYPIELAEGTQPAADLYAYVADRIGLTPAFELQSNLSPGVLIYPTVLDDSVLYVMVSRQAYWRATQLAPAGATCGDCADWKARERHRREVRLLEGVMWGRGSAPSKHDEAPLPHETLCNDTRNILYD
jgi:hypothetical protein